MRDGLHEIDLPPRRIDAADQDDALLGTYRGAFLIIGASGAYGLLMAIVEPTLNRRQRLAAILGAGAVVAGGIYGGLRPSQLARLIRDRRAPVIIAGAATAAVAASSPQKSPMSFPAAMLTTIASVPLAARTSRRFGSLVGLAYLVVVGWSARDRIGSDRQLYWNVGMSTGFLVAATSGAAIGRLSIDVRLLERARQRDRRLIDQPDRAPNELDELSAAARAIAAELDRVLLDAAKRDYGNATASVRRSIDKARSPTHHLELAPVLIAAARGERIDLVGDVALMLDTYRARPLAAPVAVHLYSTIRPGATYDARSTAALLICLKRALDNVVLYGKGLSRVEIRLTELAGQIMLEVEDDGAGVPPPTAEWGTGLSEARRRCGELGGALALERGPMGIRLVARVPTVPLPASGLDAATDRSISARTDAGLVQSVRDLKLTCLIMGLASLWCSDSRRHAAVTSALFAVIALDDLRHGAEREERPWLPAAVVGWLWPMGARPAAGWVGVYLIDATIAHGGVAWRPFTAAMTGLLARARRVRGTVDVGQIRGDVIFPSLCVMFALVILWARHRLGEIERNTLSLRERAEYIESMVPAVQTFHDVVSPIKSSGAWLEHLDLDTRRQLQRLSDSFNTPTAALRDGIMVPDPAADLQEHLAVRLSPIAVTVSGVQPRLRETREHARLLERARYFTALIGLADEIADRLLDDHPPDAFSRLRLVRVHLHMEPDGPEEMVLTVQPVLSAAPASAASYVRLQGAAAGTRGASEIMSDTRQTHRVTAEALARREG